MAESATPFFGTKIGFISGCRQSDSADIVDLRSGLYKAYRHIAKHVVARMSMSIEGDSSRRPDTAPEVP